LHGEPFAAAAVKSCFLSPRAGPPASKDRKVRAGRAHFPARTDGGGTKEQLAARLAGSAEYEVANGGTATEFVEALYRDVLGRYPEDPGEQAWIQAVNAGMPRTQAAAAFLATPESEQNMVVGYYHQFLNRSGESTGVASYVNLLQHGLSNEAVEALFMGSDEYFMRSQN
jgi:hypothetical protein